MVSKEVVMAGSRLAEFFPSLPSDFPQGKMMMVDQVLHGIFN